jgi:hypothetical protein
VALASTHRPDCARLGIARLNAFRLGVYEAWIKGIINGVDPATGPGKGLLIAGAAIQHVLNEQTDTASFTTRGFTPVAGQLLEVRMGDGSASHQLFGGRILETTVGYEGRAAEVQHQITAVDPTWLMQRQLVLETYVNQSATAIVLDLVTRYTRHVTTTFVQAGLPVIDAITFTNEQVPSCLTEICKRIGAAWYLDYQGRLHVFTTESETAAPITDTSARTSRHHTLTEDLSQVVTRVIGRGGGVGVAIDLPAGEVEIPVDEGDEPQSWYAASGGLVEINTQRVSYSGVRGLGATGAFVGTGNAPSAAPTPVPTAGNTHPVGNTFKYGVTFVTASGETVIGPLGAITIQAFTPVAPPGMSARSRAPATYPSGLISPGANGQIVFMVQIGYRGGVFGPLGANSATYTWDGYDWDVYLGPRQQYQHSDGSSAYYYPALEPGGPAAPTQVVYIYRWDYPVCTNWMSVSSDSFLNNEWCYQCACSYGSQGYLAPSGFGSVRVTNIPVSKAPGVTARKVYRTTANGSALKLLTTIANNTDTSYTDTVADAGLGVAPPTTDTSGIQDTGQVLVGATSLPVSSTVPFSADMIGGVTPGGWVRASGLVLRYTGIGSGVLTGVPAAGLGSITATIRYGAQVLIQPRLVGVPASGTGALLQPIRKGDTVSIRREWDDFAAQDAMAERLKPPGRRHH